MKKLILALIFTTWLQATEVPAILDRSIFTPQPCFNKNTSFLGKRDVDVDKYELALEKEDGYIRYHLEKKTNRIVFYQTYSNKQNNGTLAHVGPIHPFNVEEIMRPPKTAMEHYLIISAYVFRIHLEGQMRAHLDPN